MPRQLSFMNLDRGSLGQTTFVKSRDGFRAQVKKVMPPGKFKTDPAFQKVREHNSEFQTATQAGNLLRSSIDMLIPTGNDARMVSRLLKVLMRVIKADTVSLPGKRNVIDGNLSLLRGFEFNDVGTSKYCKAQLAATINRVTGELDINISSFVPTSVVKPPYGVTHFEIVTAGTELNLEGATYKTVTKSTGVLPLNATPQVVAAVHAVTPNSTNPLMLVFGVNFYEQLNGVVRPFHEGKENVVRIVDIQKP